MTIYSTYKVKIKHYNHIFKDTISVYRAAVDYLIHVCIEDWDNITSYEKPLEKQRFVETLIHKTKDNPNVAYDFDVHFYKFPCYLRRGAISEAIGKVSSYKSNFASWKANPQGEAPSVPKAGYIYPSMYRTNMYEQMQDEISDDLEEIIDTPKQPKKKIIVDKSKTAKCPQCGGNLVFEGGCNTCKDCGWSKCD